MTAETTNRARILSDIIRRRRTIKPTAFLDRPIPEDVIDELLECANWAPTHGKTEPWRFTVFTGEARVPLGEMLADIYQQITPVDQIKPAKITKFRITPTQAQCVISIGMQRQLSGRIPQIEEIQAVACAVQNLHLAATAHGLGAAWSSGNAICSPLFRDALGLEKDDLVLGLLYLGYPSGEWPEGERRPISEKVTRVESEAAFRALSSIRGPATSAQLGSAD